MPSKRRVQLTRDCSCCSGWALVVRVAGSRSSTLLLRADIGKFTVLLLFHTWKDVGAHVREAQQRAARSNVPPAGRKSPNFTDG